jgi:hypothetical protein
MRLASCALAVVALALVLGACGESSEDKAKSTVCDARDDIGQQVDALKNLTPATVTTDAVTQHVTAIKNDLQDIAGAQSDLSSDRRSQVEAATKTFTNSVQTIASQAVTSLSASDAKTALTTAVQQLQASYQKTLAPLDCG